MHALKGQHHHVLLFTQPWRGSVLFCLIYHLCFVLRLLSPFSCTSFTIYNFRLRYLPLIFSYIIYHLQLLLRSLPLTFSFTSSILLCISLTQRTKHLQGLLFTLPWRGSVFFCIIYHLCFLLRHLKLMIYFTLFLRLHFSFRNLLFLFNIS